MTGKHTCDDCGERFETVPRYAAHRRGHQQRIADERLLEELQRVAAEIGETPSSRKMAEHGRYGTTTYEERFGTWNAALEAAGLPIRQKWEIPTEELIEEITHLRHELGEVPGKRDMDRIGAFDSKTYITRFGSWNDALRAAGLKVTNRWDIPRSELNKAMADLGETLDKAPTPPEMDYLGEFSSHIYYRHYSTWVEAIEAAGLDPGTRLKKTGSGFAEGWTESKRQLVRERDDHECQAPGCGMTQEEHKQRTGRSLHVHHIRRPTEFDDPAAANSLDNLVTLCVWCHQQWEGARTIGPFSAEEDDVHV